VASGAYGLRTTFTTPLPRHSKRCSELAADGAGRVQRHAVHQIQRVSTAQGLGW